MTDRLAHPAQAARSRRLSADERRAQIFAATTRVLVAKGYANVTLTDVAENAGVAKGLLWHYFRDRDDLMRQTLLYLSHQIREAVTSDLDTAAAVPQVVRAVFAATAALTRTHAAELEAVDQIVHNLRTADGRQQISMSDYDSTYAEHEQLLARGQAEGSIRTADARVMAISYQGAIDAMIGYLQAHPDVDPAQHAAAVADVVLAGVAADR